MSVFAEDFTRKLVPEGTMCRRVGCPQMIYYKHNNLSKFVSNSKSLIIIFPIQEIAISFGGNASFLSQTHITHMRHGQNMVYICMYIYVCVCGMATHPII